MTALDYAKKEAVTLKEKLDKERKEAETKRRRDALEIDKLYKHMCAVSGSFDGHSEIVISLNDRYKTCNLARHGHYIAAMGIKQNDIGAPKYISWEVFKPSNDHTRTVHKVGTGTNITAEFGIAMAIHLL